ncbi:MAG: LLM class F420-dependent oxidoreductase [Acetobacteraceae bacterium]
MDFGIHIGPRGCMTTRANIMALATRAEAQGYSILGVADHVIAPVTTEVRYPYTADGVWPGAPTGECMDTLAILAFLAACTERMKLLTSVIVVPHRQPVLTAKLFATADVLSEGRVIAGVGAGWMPEEFAALGTPPFAERGAVTDEYIRAWKTLWTQDRPAMQGKYAQFDNVVFEPKPVSKPHPPIWVGGESARSLRRVAELGDGWYPVSNNHAVLLNTPARLKAGIDRMHRAVEKAGRDPTSIDIAYVWFMPPSWKLRPGPDGEGRMMFSGSADDMLEDIAALRAIGVRHCIFYLQRPTIDQTLDLQQRFAEDVIQKAG